MTLKRSAGSFCCNGITMPPEGFTGEQNNALLIALCRGAATPKRHGDQPFSHACAASPVCQGRKSTIPAKLADRVHHSECVHRGLQAQAGASLLLMEMVPGVLVSQITDALKASHSIGIGAGRGTAGHSGE